MLLTGIVPFAAYYVVKKLFLDPADEMIQKRCVGDLWVVAAERLFRIVHVPAKFLCQLVFSPQTPFCHSTVLFGNSYFGGHSVIFVLRVLRPDTMDLFRKSVRVCLFLCLSVHLSVFLSVCLPVCLSLCPSPLY